MPCSLSLAKYWLPEISQLSGSLSKTSPRPGSLPYKNVRLDSKACSTQSLRHRTCSSRKHGLIPRRSIFTSTAPQQATQVAPTTSPSSPPTPAPQSKPPPSSWKQPTQSLNSTTGLSDSPPDLKLTEDDPHHVDWTRSFHGLSSQPFNKEAADVLLAPLVEEDIEIKPDGILYLPEIKYRRILNRAFGPGGWGLAPRGESIVTPKTVTREYALVVHGRSVIPTRIKLLTQNTDIPSQISINRPRRAGLLLP